jgi:hypothetical protein
MQTRIFLPSLRKVFVLGFVVLGVAAHAEYRVTYSGGTVTSSGPYGSVTQTGWGTATGGVGGNPSRMAGPGSAAVSGPLIAKFTWFGNAWDRPDHIYVVEKTTATWGGDTGHCDDGLGGKKTPVEFGEVSKGSRIRYISGPTAVFELTVNPSADATFRSNGPAASDGMMAGDASVTYTAAVTDYALSIFSDRDTSYHKGANGLPESNTTAILSPRFGDTWVNPSTWTTEGGDGNWMPHYFSQPVFGRELIGGWINPYHEWNVGGTIFTDNFTTEWETVTKRWTYSADAFASLSEAPDSKIITLKVTDDGGSGIAVDGTYTLRIHHPFENWHLDPSWHLVMAPVVADNFTVIGDRPYSTLGADATCVWNKPPPFWNFPEWIAKLTGTQLKNPLYKFLFKVAEILMADLNGEGNQAGAGFDAVWNNHDAVHATIQGGTWSDSKILFGMTPRYMYEYDAKMFVCDAYGENGYQGEGQRVVAKIKAEYMSGTFFLIGDLGAG